MPPAHGHHAPLRGRRKREVSEVCWCVAHAPDVCCMNHQVLLAVVHSPMRLQAGFDACRRIRLASLNFGDAHAPSQPGIPTVRWFLIKAAIAEAE